MGFPPMSTRTPVWTLDLLCSATADRSLAKPRVGGLRRASGQWEGLPGARMHLFLLDGEFLRGISGLGQAFCAQVCGHLCC